MVTDYIGLLKCIKSMNSGKKGLEDQEKIKGKKYIMFTLKVGTHIALTVAASIMLTSVIQTHQIDGHSKRSLMMQNDLTWKI